MNKNNIDKKAFDRVVLKYHHKLERNIGLYIHDQTQALDIIQETFIQAYRALDAFRGECEIYTWLHRIAMNNAKNYLKSQAKYLSTVNIEEVCCEAPQTAEELLILDETKKKLLEIFDTLPKKLRFSLLLHELQGLSYQQIAQVLHCPTGTVRSRIARARVHIKLELQKIFIA